MTASNSTNECCWTDEYLMAHSEGYLVEDEHGQRVGVVDSVLWPEEPFEDAEAIVVRCTGRPDPIVIPLDEIRDIDPWNKRIVVSAMAVVQHQPVSPHPLLTTHPVT
jgi:ribosomal 30S subunit maturation factor RimM